MAMRPLLLAALLLAGTAGALSADISPAVSPTPAPVYPTPSYVALMQDQMVNADIWDHTPKIFTANYAAEGISGVANGQLPQYAEAAGVFGFVLCAPV